MLQTSEPRFTEDDLSRLSLAQSYFSLTESVAWKDLVQRLQGLVDAAQQEHFSSREVESLKIVEEKLRWQQRLLMLQSIRQIVQNQLDAREALIQDLQGDSEYEHDPAE